MAWSDHHRRTGKRPGPAARPASGVRHRLAPNPPGQVRSGPSPEPRAPALHDDPGLLGLVIKANLGAGRVDEAVHLAEAAVTMAPAAARLYGTLGTVYLSAGRYEAAAGAFQRAFQLAPAEAEAQATLGAVLRDTGRPREAVACLRRALAMRPSWAEAHSDLGDALEAQGDILDAIGAYQHAVALKPDLLPAHVRLGETLARAGRLTEALAAFERAKALKPDFARTYTRLADVLLALGQPGAAAGQYARALDLDPDDGFARWHQARLALLQGDLARGWPGYAARPIAKPASLDAPRWQGEDLAGRVLRVQGEGDPRETIQWLRFVPALAWTGVRVTLDVEPDIAALLPPWPGVTVAGAGAASPACDAWAYPSDLPRWLCPDLKSVTPGGAYLRGRPVAPRAGGPLRVVFARAADDAAAEDDALPLAAIARLARLPGISATAIGSMADRAVLEDAGIAPAGAGIAEQARLAAGADVVIAVDNTAAHLAGAFGRTLWLALPRVPDWRWFLDREDSPWYPTARLIRQSRPGEWSDVADRLESLLAEAAYPDE